jgi:hypothetical protein
MSFVYAVKDRQLPSLPGIEVVKSGPVDEMPL